MMQFRNILIFCLAVIPFFAVAQKRQASASSTLPATRSARIETFRLSTDKDWLNAWNKAKASVDTIIFGAGTYQINTATNGAGWYLERDNLTLIGAGVDKTFLTAGSAVGVTLSNNTRLLMPFVRGYLINDTAYTYTYKNSTHKGDGFIILKNRKWADVIKVGSKMMLIGGSHYLDQEFGELVTVTRKGNDTLYLKDPLSGAYSVDSSPYAAITTHDFVIPPIGKSITILMNRGYNTLAGRFISVGDNIFSVVSSVDSLMKLTLLNIGKGNSAAGTVIPIGTIVTRGRILAPWNHTKNLKIQNLTIKGQQDRVLRLDNTYTAELINVKVTRASSNANGFLYTFDFCRDIKLINCQLASLSNITAGSQISRSSGDISFFKCRFDKAKTDASEYSFNVKFDSCTFNLRGANTFILGHTVRKSFITNNTFNLDSTTGLFQVGEIQATNRVQREYTLISGNTFNITNYTETILDFPNGGKNEFRNNIITGGSMDAFSVTLNRLENGNNLYPTDNRIEDNVFNTTFKRWFISGGVYSGLVSNNTITNSTTTAPSPFGKWINLKAATISNNQFNGFRNYLVVPAGVILINNTIQ